MTDALGGVEQIERQTALRVNERTHHQRRPGHKHGWGISPNIARASPSREKPPAPVARIEVAPTVQPSIAMSQPSVISGAIESYDDVVAAFRAAKDLRGLSNSHCDELANLATGHTDAILGPTGRKNFGPLSFNAFCWALAVKFVMVVDVEREAEMAVHWADRQRELNHVRATPSRVSKIIIERATPYVMSALAKKGWETRRARKSARTAEPNP
jgi:hypothetical protein